MSSLAAVAGVPTLPVLLVVLLGGVARSGGGSRYESRSIGSTTLSGSNWKVGASYNLVKIKKGPT